MSGQVRLTKEQFMWLLSTNESDLGVVDILHEAKAKGISEENIDWGKELKDLLASNYESEQHNQ